MVLHLDELEKQFRYDLHVHSKEVSPCGRMTIDEVGDEYKKKGYDGIWLTNHFHREFMEETEGMNWTERVDFFLEPYRRASEWDKGLFVGLGAEIRFYDDPNDYLLYGLTEEMLYREGEDWLSFGLREFFRRYAHRLIIVQAHPNRQDSSSPADYRFIHGYEAINSSPRHENRNGKTQELLCICPWLIPTAGSDSHRPEDVGRSGILTDCRLTGNQVLTKILKEKRYRLIPFQEDRQPEGKEQK